MPNNVVVNDVFGPNYSISEKRLEQFSHVLDNPSECYKFYWLEAILTLIATGESVLSFSDLVDQKIASVWFTVSTYHLKLGANRQKSGEENRSSNNLEKAVNLLFPKSGLSEDADRSDILKVLKEHSQEIWKFKAEVTRSVAFHFLRPYLSVGNRDIKKASTINEIMEENKKNPLPYIIIEGKDILDRKLVVNPAWINFLLTEAPILEKWIFFCKIQFLEDRNPGVPNVRYKLKRPKDYFRVRDYSNVKKLWGLVISRNPEIIDVYTCKPIREEKYDLDHFIPWSYVGSDELWNLLPAESRVNRFLKRNNLPKWDDFFEDYACMQYELYKDVFCKEDFEIYGQFEKCMAKNLTSLWARNELYQIGNTESSFINILETHIKPIYSDAERSNFQSSFSKSLVNDYLLKK